MSRKAQRRVDAQKARIDRLLAKVQAGGFFDATTPDELYKQVTTQAYQMHREGRLRDDELRDIKAFNKGVQYDRAMQLLAAQQQAALAKAARQAADRKAVEA